MTKSPTIPVSIIHAATLENTSITTLPANLPPPADSPTPELLTDPFLRLAHIVLADLSPTTRQSTGIILGTPHGCLQADWEFDRSRRESAGRYASPAAFSRTLPSTIPSELSVKLGLHGPILNLSADNHSTTTTALHRAISWMHHLNFHWCLAGGFETGATPVPHPRAAFLLLSTIPALALATIETSPRRLPDLPLATDALTTLITWIQQSTQPHPPKILSLGSVQLVRP